MAELTTPDGTPVDPAAAAVNQEFARAMAADKPEPAAPPKRPDPAPAAAAEAVKRPRGRPRNADRPRVDAKPAAAVLSDDQRAQGVKGIVQIGAGVCLLASRSTATAGPDGKRIDNPAFKADAITLATAADDLAQAAVDTAKADPRFAALVDKVCAVGPYGALLSAVIGVSGQLVRNHRPAAALPGTVDRMELIRQAEAETIPAAA